MKKLFVFFVVVALLGFVVPSGAQIQRDTINGWYPKLITSGITKFYSRLVPNIDPVYFFLGKMSQLWGMNLPVGEKVRVIKKLGKEYDMPQFLRYAVKYNTASMDKPDSSVFMFNFFFSHGDTIRWLSDMQFIGKRIPVWIGPMESAPYPSPLPIGFEWDDITADTVGIRKFDAIGIRFKTYRVNLDSVEVMFNNLTLVYADGSKIVLDDFESDVVAKGAFEFPSGTYNFGSVKIGWQKTAKLRGTNIGKSDLSVSKVETTDSSFSVSPATATIQPDSSVVFLVTFAPNAGTVSGKVQYLIFHHNGIKGIDSVAFVGDVTTGINEISNNTPTTYSLGQNYPNPFNPSTRIKIEIPKSGFVKLTVYNVLGQLVATLVNRELSAGTYEYEFTPVEIGNLASGVYFYHIEAKGFSQTKKMMLIK